MGRNLSFMRNDIFVFKLVCFKMHAMKIELGLLSLSLDQNSEVVMMAEGNTSVLNGGHSGYISRKNLSEMGIYRGYFQKSDVKIGL